MRWIGIDVSKTTFTCAQVQGSQALVESFPMSDEGFETFRQWASKPAFQVGLEATGPYWLRLAEWFESVHIGYAVLNPRKVRRFAEASERRSKTDAIDAEILRRYGETFEPSCAPPSQGPYKQLRCISRRILQLQCQLDTERDRLEKASHDPACPAEVLQSFAVMHTELTTLIERLEHQAKRLIVRHDTMHQAYQLVLSIPGIGHKTARTLLAESGPQLLTASPKQLTGFTGLDIVHFESGSSVRKRPRISKQGNWRLRRALYMAALSAIRHNPTVKAFYQRQRQAGLQGKAALVAAMRKLLHITHGVLKHQTPFHAQMP